MIACVCFLVGAGNGLVTAWQDFRSREIHILPLGLMALSGILFRSFKHQWFWLHAFMVNMMMLIAMMGIIYGFYRMKGEKNIMDVKMGWGDVIFLIILGIWFDPEWFILFYSLNTLILSMVFTIARAMKLISANYPIPLAGILGISFAFTYPFIM